MCSSDLEGAVTVMAFLVLIRAVRRPHPVHLTTTILLTLLTGILLWANLRPTVWQEDFGGGIDAPTGLDPITKAMFWRGWPLSPCMVCLIHGMRFRPSGIEGCVLVVDGVLFLVTLFAAKAVCESGFRWLQHRKLRAISDAFHETRETA